MISALYYYYFCTWEPDLFVVLMAGLLSSRATAHVRGQTWCGLCKRCAAKEPWSASASPDTVA
jgi:hypothetical protein